MYERVRCEMCGSELEDGVDSIIDHVVDGDCERIRFLNEIGDLRRELAVARTEAERYRQRYEALRAAVEGVVERIDAAGDEEHHSSLVDYSQYHAGREDAFERTGEWLREVLAKVRGEA